MNREKPYIYKRVVAYIIDLLVVTLISGILTVVFFNNEEYEKDSKRLVELTNKVTSREITTDDFNKQYDEINYDLTMHSKDVTVMTIAVTIVYYVVMSYFCHGITLGKYFMKLRIVSASGKEINIFNYFLRSLIINSILSNVVTLILVSTLSKQDFINISSKVSNVFTIIIIVSFILMMYRNDGRGLHDLLGNTKIVNLKDSDQVKDANIIKK